MHCLVGLEGFWGAGWDGSERFEKHEQHMCARRLGMFYCGKLYRVGDGIVRLEGNYLQGHLRYQLVQLINHRAQK